ncbi:MAG: VWA domain-containing protein [Planctomycetota bacterium]|nr:VWA domain-containing protein [Planctomycetota bacterium]
MTAPAEGSAKPTGSNWRGGKSPTGAGKSSPEWQREPATAAGRDSTHGKLRSLWIVGLLGACLIGGGWLTWFEWRPSAKLPILSVLEADYDDPFPPNSWAREDRDAYQTQGAGPALDGVTVRLSRQTLTEFVSESAKARNGSGTPSVAVTYVSAHGLVNSQHEPCLAVRATRADDDRNWITLSQILERIQKSRSRGQVSLLILDSTRHPPLVEAGQLASDFVDRVIETVRAKGGDDLLVLTSAGRGERAWGAPSFRETVFGHYLRMGLSGCADQPEGNRDSRVSLKELAAYVSKEVAGWAEANRGVTQRPLLFGKIGGVEIGRDASDDSDASVLSQVVLTWALPAGQLAEIVQRHNKDASSEVESRSPAAEEFAKAWMTLNDLQKSALGTNALKVAGLRRQLWQLELEADGGSQYASRVKTGLDHWNQEAAELKLSSVQSQAISQGFLPPESSPVPLGAFWDQAAALAGNRAAPSEGLLKLAEESARAESPADARVAQWILPRLKVAAEKRRLAADRAFALAAQVDANQDAQNEVAELIAAARREYAAAQQLGNEIAGDYALCDHWANRLPMFVRWLQFGGQPANDAVVKELLAIATAVVQLSETLGLAPGQTDEAGPSIQRLTAHRELLREVTGTSQGSTISKLDGLVDRVYQRLLAQNALTASDMVEAQALLASGMLPSSSGPDGNPVTRRVELQQKCSKLPQTTVAGEQQSKSVLFGDLEKVVKKLLEPASAVADVDSKAQTGEVIRLSLKRIQDDQSAESPASSPSRTSDPWKADNAARTASAYLWRCDSQALIHDRLQYEVQCLQRARAVTALDDFWGRAVADEAPVYEQAAVAALKGISDSPIHRDSRKPWWRDRQHIVDRLSDYRRLSEHLINIESVPLVEKAGLDELATQIRLTPKLPAEKPVAIPEGTAVVIARDAVRGLRGSRKIEVDGRLTSRQVNVPLKAEEIEPGVGGAEPAASAATVPSGVATLFYRGHGIQAPLKIQSADRTATVWTPPQVDLTRITLRSTDQQPQWETFLLDCSASMREPAPFEGQDQGVSRFESARATLNQLLGTLATRQGDRVGVMLYGHRVGWSTKETGQLLTQTATDVKVPEGLMPYEDVESILPLGRFDEINAERVRRRLAAVKPWGETPLYLAMTRALEELGREDHGAQRTVIAITDGMNYQFNPTPEKARSADQVIRAAEKLGARVCIIGFGIAQAEADASRREYERIANSTGGVYVNVRDSQMLLRQLEEILGPRDFTVRDASGETQREAKAGAGQTVEWKLTGGRPQELELRTDFRRQSLRVWGGESLELRETAGSSEFQSAAYERGLIRYHRLIDSSRTDLVGLRLGVHAPRRDGNRLDFILSLQNADARFVSRPSEVWIEITPLVGETPLETHKILFQDLSFMNGTPVPVLKIPATHWPAEARRARVEAWCRWDATAPSRTIEVASLLTPASEPAGDEAWLTLPDVEDSQYRVRLVKDSPWRVELVEKFPPNTVPPLRVELFGGLRPSEVRRQYFPEAGLALHQFEFKTSLQLLSNDLELRLVSRPRMQRDSAHLESAVEVFVPPPSDALAPSLDPQ